MRKFKKILLLSFASLFILMSLFVIFAFVSPYPTTWAVRALFGATSYTDHVDLEATRENVTILDNIKYPSKYKNNNLDIIYPTNHEQPLPVIYWVHGGAFVAGDKKDVTNYMIMLANEGYVIVNINYQLAPGAKYPAQLIQIGEAYEFIENNDSYPFMNKDIIYFGGDSAGAHIAAQFITIQTNPNYLSLLNEIKETKNVKKVVHKNITGAILFAGPYDFNELSHLVKSRVNKEDNSPIKSLVSFIAKRIGQAYLNTLEWKNNEKFKVLSIVDYVDSNFPKTFITDGRTISFEEHAKELENSLIQKGVLVTSVYHDYDLMHEYQFNLGTVSDDDNNYALITFDYLLDFLNNQ